MNHTMPPTKTSPLANTAKPRILRKTPAWLIAIMGLVVLAIPMLISWGLFHAETKAIHRETKIAVEVIEPEIHEWISTRHHALERMARRWEKTGTPSRKEWESDARNYIHDYAGLQAIEWVDETYHIRWAFPVKGNEAAVNLDLSYEPTRLDAIKRARQSRRTTNSKVIDLAQGGKGFLTFVPLYTEEQFQGFILGVFNSSKLIESIMDKRLISQRFGIRAESGGKILYLDGDEQLFDSQFSHQLTMTIGDMPWTITVAPRPMMVGSVRSPLSWVVLASGLILAALLAMIQFLSRRSKSSLHALNKANSQLLQEINDRQLTQNWADRVIESSPFGILMINSDRVITLVNSEMERTFGYTSAEMIGQPVELLLPNAFRNAHPQQIASYLEKPEARAMGQGRDLFGQRKDGSEVPVEIGLNPLRTDQGLFVLASVIDITERKRLDNIQKQLNIELERKNTEMEQFVYAVSHDLKSPVVTQMGFTDLMVKDLENGDIEEAKESLTLVRKAVKTMHDSITDLLELCRIGRVPMKPQNVEVAELIDDLIEQLSPQFTKADAKVENQITHDIHVFADPKRLRQVFQNLLTNALKYGHGEEDPLIIIGIIQKEEELQFFVRDNGPGIDPKFHERIFQLFQRLDPSKEGTGVGLTNVSKIMEVMKGRIWIESEAGQGATFWIALPRQQPLPLNSAA